MIIRTMQSSIKNAYNLTNNNNFTIKYYRWNEKYNLPENQNLDRDSNERLYYMDNYSSNINIIPN